MAATFKAVSDQSPLPFISIFHLSSSRRGRVVGGGEDQGSSGGPSRAYGSTGGDPPRALVKLQFLVDVSNLRGIPAPSSTSFLFVSPPSSSLVKFNDYVSVTSKHSFIRSFIRDLASFIRSFIAFRSFDLI